MISNPYYKERELWAIKKPPFLVAESIFIGK